MNSGELSERGALTLAGTLGSDPHTEKPGARRAHHRLTQARQIS